MSQAMQGRVRIHAKYAWSRGGPLRVGEAPLRLAAVDRPGKVEAELLFGEHGWSGELAAGRNPGDNIIGGNILAAADRFRRQSEGAHILLKEVPDAERFGVAEI